MGTVTIHNNEWAIDNNEWTLFNPFPLTISKLTDKVKWGNNNSSSKKYNRLEKTKSNFQLQYCRMDNHSWRQLAVEALDAGGGRVGRQGQWGG